MSILVFYSNTNTHGRVDATGAFIPEAKKFKDFYGVPDEDFIGIDCTVKNKTKLRNTVFHELSKRENLGLLAFFGHGWPKGIQFGIRLRHIPEMVSHMNPNKDIVVALYACLAAENDVRDTNIAQVGPGTDGGFADTLRDTLVRDKGVTDGWIDAHKTAGHTTWNPNVVRFLCSDVEDPDDGGEGGSYIVAPRSQFWKKWVRALKDTRNMRYWFTTHTEIEIKLRLQNK
jgi:hypothetical protein